MLHAERYALQRCTYKRVKMSHSTWLVYGGYDSLEPKHFIKCLADDQMLWLELLRYDILENVKKIVLSYYFPMEHVCQLPRGIASFLHILLPRCEIPTLIPPLWLANSYYSSSRSISERKCFLTHNYSFPSLSPTAAGFYCYYSIMWYYKFPLPVFIFSTILLGQRPCLDCPYTHDS